MTDKPTVGRISFGPTEPYRMTPEQQRSMDAALRSSVLIVPNTEVERLKDEIDRLRSTLKPYLIRDAESVWWEDESDAA